MIDKSIYGPFTEWLDHLPVAVTIGENDWLFPIIESVHVLALAIVFGSIAMVDLRLLGVSLKSRAVDELSLEVLPWTWIAFIGAALSGLLMFSSAATRYAGLWPFQAKMILLALAGLNMLVFHFGSYRHVGEWAIHGRVPAAARFAGATSLVLWTSIIVCGRWVGFL